MEEVLEVWRLTILAVGLENACADGLSAAESLSAAGAESRRNNGGGGSGGHGCESQCEELELHVVIKVVVVY